MKKVLFDTVVRTTEALIRLSDWFYAAVIWIPSNLGELSRVTIARLGLFLMNAIDEETVKKSNDLLPSEQKAELQKQQIELHLLSAASMVRDHYLETGEWTDGHSEAIEALGNQLLNECDWEEDDIHDYLRSVVEAGTDLHYGIEGSP